MVSTVLLCNKVTKLLSITRAYEIRGAQHGGGEGTTFLTHLFKTRAPCVDVRIIHDGHRDLLLSELRHGRENTSVMPVRYYYGYEFVVCRDIKSI